MAAIGKYAWIPFAVAGFGNILGGLLSGFLLRRGFSVTSARKVSVTFFATLMTSAIPAVIVRDAGSSIGLISLEDKSTEEVRRLNTEEVQAFLQKDAKAMAHLWSDDLVVTNPLNKFVTKQQVLGMVESGFLIITSYDRQIEYVRSYGDMVIVAGNETVVWGGKIQMPGRQSISGSREFG